MADSQPSSGADAPQLNYRHLQTRENNPNWRGGRSIAPNGYVIIRVGVGQPMADVRGYAYEHRIVASEKIGRLLARKDHVHHINGVKSDNRPENLEVVSSQEHRKRHRKYERNLRDPGEPNELSECECGCGATFNKFDASGRPRRFISGHNPHPQSMSDHVLAYLEIVPESGRSDFIAGFLGFERVQVTNALSKLRRRGLVQKRRGEWELCNE